MTWWNILLNTVVTVFNNLRKHPKKSLICLWWCVLSNEGVLVGTVCNHFLIPFYIYFFPTPPNHLSCPANGMVTSWSIFAVSWPFLDLLLIHICILRLCFFYSMHSIPTPTLISVPWQRPVHGIVHLSMWLCPQPNSLVS